MPTRWLRATLALPHEWMSTSSSVNWKRCVPATVLLGPVASGAAVQRTFDIYSDRVFIQTLVKTVDGAALDSEDREWISPLKQSHPRHTM